MNRRKPLFIQWCAKDALDGMQSLTAFEELAYRRLIDLIYATEDNLADDDRRLAWMTKVGRQWRAVKQALLDQGKIEVINGRISVRRCRDELAKAERNIAQKRAARAARGDARSASFDAQNRASTEKEIIGADDGPIALFNNESDATAATTDEPSAEPTGEPTNRELLEQERKKEGGADAPTTKGYAWAGRIIRLKRADYDRWRKAYHAIRDFDAALQAADDWYGDHPPDGGKWFFGVSGWLKRDHERALEQRAKVDDDGLSHGLVR